MKLEQRIERLEDAHRALAAQHLALLGVSRLMLPLMGADPVLLRESLRAVRDTNIALMQEHKHDDEFQADVQHWLDVLSSEILAGADKCQRRPSRPD